MTAIQPGFGSQPFYLDRAVYTTITVMSALILCDSARRVAWPGPAGPNSIHDC